MLLDVRSIERAYEAVPFFDRFVARDTARVTHAAILNELPVLNGPPGAGVPEIDCDKLFNDSNMRQVSPLDVEGKLTPLKEINNQGNRSLPRVEKIPLHYYEEGIEQFRGALQLRQLVAMEHWHGNKEYTALDAIRKVARSATWP